MGTIKFEIDLPEFEKELSINLTIHRDGEVVYTTTSSPSVDNNTNLLGSGSVSKISQEKMNSNTSVDREVTVLGNESESTQKKSPSPKRRGNLMSLDI